MNFTFVVLVLYVAVNKFKHVRGDVCLSRSDGCCRTVEKEEDMHELNKQFKKLIRLWSLTLWSECIDVEKVNDIRFCKSTCERVRNKDFSGLDCSGRKTACVANDRTNICKVYRDICQAAAAYCNGSEKDTYVAQTFRCTRNGLIKPGQTGKCASKFKDD